MLLLLPTRNDPVRLRVPHGIGWACVKNNINVRVEMAFEPPDSNLLAVIDQTLDGICDAGYGGFNGVFISLVARVKGHHERLTVFEQRVIANHEVFPYIYGIIGVYLSFGDTLINCLLTVTKMHIKAALLTKIFRLVARLSAEASQFFRCVVLDRLWV